VTLALTKSHKLSLMGTNLPHLQGGRPYLNRW